MTNLSKEQQDLLDDVSAERAATKVLIARRQAEFDKDIYDIEKGLRVVARAAFVGGVPLRRIGKALGTTDHGTQKAYVAEPTEYEADTSYVPDISPEVIDLDTVPIQWKNNKEFSIYSEGDWFDFWVLDVDGYHIIKRSSGNVGNAGEIPDAVIGIINEELPDADCSEL